MLMLRNILFALVLLPTLLLSQPTPGLVQLGFLQYNPVTLAGVWHHVDDFGNEYALVGTSQGLSIVDVNNPASPQQIFTVPSLPNNWRELRTWEGYLYMVSEADSSAVTIVDLNSLPDTIYSKVWRGDFHNEGKLRRAHAVQCFEGYLYLFGGNNLGDGATICDLTDPWNPVITGSYNLEYLHDGFVRNDTLWGSEIYEGRFSVVDISDKNNPVLLATNPTPGNFNHNSELNPAGNVLFTTDEVPFAPLASFDVSDLENIRMLDTYRCSLEPDGEVHNVRVFGNFLLCPSYRGQLSIVDATQPDNLIETAIVDMGNALIWDADPYLPSGIVLATDKNAGLYIFQPTYIQAAYLRGTVTDAVTGLPINKAGINIVSLPPTDSSGVDGTFKTGTAQAGAYNVLVTKMGYFPKQMDAVQLVTGQTTTLNVELTPEMVSQYEPGSMEAKFDVLPTMFNEKITLRLPANSAWEKVILRDAQGKTVFEQNVQSLETTLYLPANLNTGVYFIGLQNGNVQSIAKQVVKIK